MQAPSGADVRGQGQLTSEGVADARVIDEVVVRPATSGDIDNIVAVSMDCFYGQRALGGGSGDWMDLIKAFENPEGEPYVGVEYRAQRDRLFRRLADEMSTTHPFHAVAPKTAVFAAEDPLTGAVVGAVEMILLPYPALPSPEVPYLFNLCVDKRNRARGLGRRLVDACEAQAREWGFQELFLHVEREPVQELYNKYGYSATHQQPTWIQLNLQHKLVLPYEAKTRFEGSWVMMHKKLETPTE